MKNTIKFLLVSTFVFAFSFTAWAVTKPPPDADLGSYSYVFYLYYDNGGLFADRDFQINYDIINEKFTETPIGLGAYKIEIANFKSDIVKTVEFDPRQGDSGFTAGKIQVKAPYVPDGRRASFLDNQVPPRQFVTIFMEEGALCNDDGSCDSVGGESEKTCPSDCKKSGPRPTVAPTPVLEEGPDLMLILIYVISGVGVAVVVWFGWKWWKKKKEESFLPPPPPPAPPPIPSPPLPPALG